MKNKENEEIKTKSKKIKENSNEISKNYILEIFLKIFVLISAILALTLYFYLRANNIYEEEMSMTRDIHHLRAYLKGYDNNFEIKGYVEITEVHEGLNIIGRIEGLERGSTHGLHILEYSDITDLEKNKITDDVLKHFNPTNKLHSCPSTNYDDDQNFHYGDLGNVIANEYGIAFFSIIRKIPLRSLNGRIVVISDIKDKCDPTQEIDLVKDILGYGLLNAYKPKINIGVDKSNDYFLREINSVNKKEFEKVNNINKPTVISQGNNNDNKKKVISPVVKHVKNPKEIMKPISTSKKLTPPVLENNSDSINYKTKESQKEGKLLEEKKEDESKFPVIDKISSNENKPQEKNNFVSDMSGDKLFSDKYKNSPDNHNYESPNDTDKNKKKQRNNRFSIKHIPQEPTFNLKDSKVNFPNNKNELNDSGDKQAIEKANLKIENENKNEIGHPPKSNINHSRNNDLFVFPFGEIKNNNEPIIEDTHHTMNHFNNLFEDEDYHEKVIKNLDQEKDRPVLVNKSNEPQFLHLNNEHKLNKNLNTDLPLFIRPINPIRVNEPVKTEPIRNPNDQIEDIFKKLFKDQDENNKIITFKPVNSYRDNIKESKQNSFPSKFEQNINPMHRLQLDDVIYYFIYI